MFLSGYVSMLQFNLILPFKNITFFKRNIYTYDEEILWITSVLQILKLSFSNFNV